jgi:hypothetical protein
MRKITLKIARSLYQGKPCKISNTYTDGEKVFLHDNLIAFKRENGLSISLAGWPTVTTRERINGLLKYFYENDDLRIYQRYGDQYISTKRGDAQILDNVFYAFRYKQGKIRITDQGLIPEAEIDCFFPSVKRRVL